MGEQCNEKAWVPDGHGLDEVVREVIAEQSGRVPVHLRLTSPGGIAARSACDLGLGEWWTGVSTEVNCPRCLEVTAPKRIQRKRTRGWRMPEGAVYVGRPTRWGNPVIVTGEPCTSTAAESVEHYRNLVTKRASFHPNRNNKGGGFWHVTANPVNARGDLVPTERQIRDSLAGMDLACWCPLDQPCHADVLLELANQAPALPDYDLIWTEMHDPDGTRFRSGHGVIVQGADVPREAMEAAVTHAHGDGWHHVVIEVQHLYYQRRVKNCSEHGSGFGCDSEGEWHAHWHGVKHNPLSDCCYTLALPVWPHEVTP